MTALTALGKSCFVGLELFHHLCVIQENQNIREGCYEENYTRFRNVCLSQKFNNKVETQKRHV